MEHIVTSHIMNHADKNNILYPLQRGFRSKRSCETQLIEFIDEITINMSSGKQTDILIMDFIKAFDKVSHSLLVLKTRSLWNPRENQHMDTKLPVGQISSCGIRCRKIQLYQCRIRSTAMLCPWSLAISILYK